mmetsp:Transcript_857/g.3135  ORF Transcript_857/g.3135 Transcript_857/m.3135 type:complete len:454 (-) Transcript_857:4509-5870(-)
MRTMCTCHGCTLMISSRKTCTGPLPSRASRASCSRSRCFDRIRTKRRVRARVTRSTATISRLNSTRSRTAKNLYCGALFSRASKAVQSALPCAKKLTLLASFQACDSPSGLSMLTPRTEMPFISSLGHVMRKPTTLLSDEAAASTAAAEAAEVEAAAEAEGEGAGGKKWCANLRQTAGTSPSDSACVRASSSFCLSVSALMRRWSSAEKSFPWSWSKRAMCASFRSGGGSGMFTSWQRSFEMLARRNSHAPQRRFSSAGVRVFLLLAFLGGLNSAAFLSSPIVGKRWNVPDKRTPSRTSSRTISHSMSGSCSREIAASAPASAASGSASAAATGAAAAPARSSRMAASSYSSSKEARALLSWKKRPRSGDVVEPVPDARRGRRSHRIALRVCCETCGPLAVPPPSSSSSSSSSPGCPSKTAESWLARSYTTKDAAMYTWRCNSYSGFAKPRPH